MLQEKRFSDGSYEINQRETELFISTIAGSCYAKVSFQYFDDKKQGRVKPAHCHGTLAENLDFLSSINAKAQASTSWSMTETSLPEAVAKNHSNPY